MVTGPSPRTTRPTVVPSSQLSPTIAAARRTLAQRQENVRTLTQHIGRPDFYNVMARVDPRSATRWNEMAQVQARFASGESRYDAQTRTYSESMRESLHRAAIGLYRQSPPGTFYDHFVAIHPALFNANGAFSLPVADQLRVLGNTHGSMARGSVALDLGNGGMQFQNYAPLANQVAEQTRRSREARGLPITPR